MHDISILIIDDDPRLRLLVATRLQTLGYCIDEVDTGEQALLAFDPERHQAVLVDVHLPGMDGQAVLEALVPKAPDTPFIMLSGEQAAQDAIRTMRAGAWDYVVKTENFLGELEQIISKALARSRFLAAQRGEMNTLREAQERSAEELALTNERLKQEIAERKNAQQALTEQVDFLQTLIDALPNPIFFKDKNIRYIGCNEAFREIVGLERDEILGEGTDSVLNDSNDFFISKDRQLLEEGGVQQYEVRIPYANGEEHDIIVRKALYYDSQGNPKGIVGTSTDVTELKAMQQKLRQSEEQLQELLGATPLPAVLVEPGSHRVLFANRSAYDIFKVRPEDAVDLNTDFFYDNTLDRDRLEKMLYRDGFLRDQEILLKNSEGKRFWALSTATLISIEDNPAVFISFINITERKELEETLRKFEAIANASADYMILINRERMVEAANNALCNFLGGREKVVGKRASTIWGMDSFTEFAHPLLENAFKGNKEHSEDWMTLAQGSGGCYDSQYFPFRNDEGLISHVVVVIRDVTEAETARMEEIRSREYFRTLFESSTDPIVLFDYGHRIIGINTAATQAFALSKAQVTGAAASILHPSEVAFEAFRRRTEPTLEKAGSWTGEWTFAKNDGTPLESEVSISVMPGEDGGEHGYVAIIRDITLRKNAERRLRAALDETEALYQNSLIGIGMTKHGQITRINAKGAQIFGYVPEALIGRRPALFLPSEADFENIRQKVYSTLASTGQFTMENRLMRPDGTSFWCHVQAKPLMPGELDQGIIWTFMDISERRYNETVAALLYRIANAVSDAPNLDSLYTRIHAALDDHIDAKNLFIALLDDDKESFKFVYFKDMKDDFLGATYPVNDMSLGSLTARVLRTQRPLLVTKSELPKSLFLKEANREDGPEVMVRKQFYSSQDINEEDMLGAQSEVWLGVPLKVEGEVIGAVAVQHYTNPQHFTAKDADLLLAVSEQAALAIVRKRREEDLYEAKELAESANRSKSEFLANMSHEIRTPLNGVLGMLQLLQITEMNDEQKDYVETALSSGRSLLSIINDILDFTKIEAGKMEIITERFEVRSFVADVLATFRGQAETKGLRLELTVSEDIPPAVIGGKGRLRQVLFNLVGNAIKFTEQGSVSVDIHPILRRGNTIRLLFTVSDTGIGIPDEKQLLIFEPFTQVDGSYVRRHQGTGLGLGIVKRLVDLMHGSLALESSENTGTSVYLAFDFLMDTPPPLDGDSPQYKAVASKSLRLLVVEDNRVNRIMTARMLGKMGHIAETASDGHKALEQLASKKYDAVFMDVQMPEMDGLETTRLIREGAKGLDSSIPIIAMTAHTMYGARESFLESGMNDYIAKPVEMDQIRQILIKHFPEAHERTP